MSHRQRWYGLAALTIARAGIGFQFQSIAALGPFATDAFGLDKTQFGLLVGLYLLPGVVIALPGGLLGARFGDRRVALVGLLLMAIGGGALAMARSMTEAGAARLVSGTGGVILNVLVTKMVADAFEGKERLLAMSFVVNAWPIGIGLALFVVGRLNEQAGWHAALASSAAVAVVGLLLVALVHRDPPARSSSSAPAPAGGLASIGRRGWSGLLVASLPWLLYNAAFQIEMAFLPSFLIDVGTPLAKAGTLAALTTVMFVLGVQLGGVVLKRAASADRACQVGIAGWCVALLLIAAQQPPEAWLIVGGLLGGIPAAAFVALPAEWLRPANRGAGMGVFFTVYYIGCAVLPALAGHWVDRHGGAAALWMAAALAAACVPVVALFRRMPLPPDR